LCVKKKKSQYIGVLGYPFARRIKRRACPYLQTSRISISSRNPMFLTQINRIGKKSCGPGENFSQSGSDQDLGDLGWSCEMKLDGAEIKGL
jgi:hypothetical protein